MKKKILTAIVALSFPFTIVACGTDMSTQNNTQKNDQNKITYASSLNEFISNYVATYEVNHTDVNNYYFKNEHYSLGKSFDELENVNHINARHYTDGSSNSYIDFSTIDELKSGVTMNSDSSFSLFFNDDSEEYFVNFHSIQNLDNFHLVGTHNKAASYNEFIENGCLFLDSEHNYTGIKINNFMNISIPDDITCADQLDYFKDIFGRPSIIVESVTSGNTVSSLDLYWCFEKTSLKMTVMDSDNEAIITNCTFYWRNYEQTLNALLDINDITLVGYKRDNLVYDSEIPASANKNTSCQYAVNLPSDITLKFDDNDVSIANKSASEIFSELGVAPFAINQVANGSYELYSSYAYDSLAEGVSINEKYTSLGYRVDSIVVTMHTGYFIPNITFLGISPLDTADDFQKIYGRCDNITDGSKNEKFYNYYNVEIGNYKIDITIKTFNETVSFVSLDKMTVCED